MPTEALTPRDFSNPQRDKLNTLFAERVSVEGDLMTGPLHIQVTDLSFTASAFANELVIECSGIMGQTWVTENDGQIVLAFADEDDDLAAVIQFDHNTDAMFIKIGNVELVRWSSVGMVGNETGTSAGDFRWEGDTAQNLFKIDAGNESVHIDNNLLTGAGVGDLVMANSNWLRWINNAGTTSANFGITGDGADNLKLNVPGTFDNFQFHFAGTIRAQIKEENSGAGLLFLGESSADHSAPAANGCVLYIADNGGKTELRARFNTGAVQVVAAEP